MDGDFPDEEQQNDDLRILPAWNGIANGVQGAVQAEQGHQERHHDGAEDLTLKRLVRIVANLQHQLVVLQEQRD